MKTMMAPEILNHGSLMTCADQGVERCLGYMFNFIGHAIFEPIFGKLDVTPEAATVHNQLLSQAEIEGLDKNCGVGLGGMFYTRKENDRTIIATWLGEVVSREVQVRGRVISCTRKGMTFRGRLRRNGGKNGHRYS
jgi:hypothetical protein